MQYPKVGETNSAARVGIVSASGGPTAGSSSRATPATTTSRGWSGRRTPARWSSSASTGRKTRDQIIIGRCPHGPGEDGTHRAGQHLGGGGGRLGVARWREELHLGERAGWVEALYVVSRDGRTSRLVTKGDYDVLEVKGIDPKGGWLYYIASPENPVQRYLFRDSPRRQGLARAPEPGPRAGQPHLRYGAQLPVRHRDLLQPGQPTDQRLIRLPGHQPVRTLVDNQDLRARVTALKRPTVSGSPSRRKTGPSSRGCCSSRRTSTPAGSIPSSSSSTAAPEPRRSRTNGADTTSGTPC